MHPEYETFDKKTVKMFMKMTDDEQGTAKLVDAGVISMCNTILVAHPS